VFKPTRQLAGKASAIPATALRGDTLQCQAAALAATDPWSPPSWWRDERS
jgi:hypothetical protein